MGIKVLPERFARLLRWVARLSLGQAIIFLPFRYHFTLIERPTPPLYWQFTDILLYISDLFLLLTLICWGAEHLLSLRPIRTGPIFLSLPIAFLTGIGLATASTSIQPPISLYHAIRLVMLAGLYLFLINETAPFVYLFPAVGIQLLIQSTTGIAQYWLQRSLGLASLGEINLDPLQSGVSIVWVHGTRILRAYGLTDHPNLLGGCLAFSLLILLLWIVKGSPGSKLLVPALFALGSLCLLFTYSRSAWLAFGAGATFSAVFLLKTLKNEMRRKTFGLVSAGLVLFSPFLWWNAEAIGVRLNWQGSFAQVAHENQSVGERALLNRAAIEIFQDHPWTGTGLSTFPYALREKYPDLPVSYSPPHLVFFDAAAELGVFGALVYAGISLFPWAALWLKRKQLDLTPELVVASALLLALTVASLFDYYPWFQNPGRLWQWLAWGLWGMIYQRSLPSK